MGRSQDGLASHAIIVPSHRGQKRRGLLVKTDRPRPVALAMPDPDRPGVEVDIAQLQCEGFRDPQAAAPQMRDADQDVRFCTRACRAAGQVSVVIAEPMQEALVPAITAAAG